MHCKNCGHVAEKSFYSYCGQSTRVGRLTLRSLLDEIYEGIFKINRGFLYTLQALFTQPDTALKAFLDGKRKRYFKPIAYVLTLSTLYFLITQSTAQNTWLGDFLSGWLENALERNPDATPPMLLVWFSKNYAYSALLLLPVFSLASFLSFRSYGQNYVEHIVINAYITGQQAVLYASLAFLGAFIKYDFMEFLPFLAAILYNYWVFYRFFSGGNPVVSVLRITLTYCLYFVCSVCLLLVDLAFIKL